MRWPLRYQVLFPLLTLLVGMVILTAWIANASVSTARQQVVLQVRKVAQTLVGPPPVPVTNLTVLEQMKRLSGADFCLRSSSTTVSTLPLNHVQLPEVYDVVEDWRTLTLGPRVQVGDEIFLVSGVRLPHRAETPDGAVLYIMYPENQWNHAWWAAVQPSLLLGGGAALAALLGGAGVSRHLVRRIQEIDRRTRMIANGDFSPMTLPLRDDEFRDLALSLNEMAQKLATLQEAVRGSERLRLLGQLSGGLAHQLRNGLTGARLAVQLHSRSCKDPGETEALSVALRQLSLLEAQISRFLDLGHEGTNLVECVSFRALVEDNLSLLRPRARHARTDLRWVPIADPCLVHGDPSQLGQVVLNLVSNALEAAGPGGWVEVVCRRSAQRGSHVIFEVFDSGSGPPQEIAGRIFEPFVTGKSEGIGLGLAVVAQVVAFHGGNVAWDRAKESTRFCVELPAEAHQRSQ